VKRLPLRCRRAVPSMYNRSRARLERGAFPEYWPIGTSWFPSTSAIGHIVVQPSRKPKIVGMVRDVKHRVSRSQPARRRHLRSTGSFVIHGEISLNSQEYYRAARPELLWLPLGQPGSNHAERGTTIVGVAVRRENSQIRYHSRSLRSLRSCPISSVRGYRRKPNRPRKSRSRRPMCIEAGGSVLIDSESARDGMVVASPPVSITTPQVLSRPMVETSVGTKFGAHRGKRELQADSAATRRKDISQCQLYGKILNTF
jgi:hypothetical protein